MWRENKKGVKNISDRDIFKHSRHLLEKKFLFFETSKRYFLNL